MVRRTAAAVALALVLAGCSAGDQGDGAPPSDQGDAVAWAERVCSSVAPEVERLSAGPDIDPSNPEAAKVNLVAYLDTLVAALDRMVGGMRDAGDPPVPDGEIAADRAVSTLEEARTSVQAARDELAAADIGDPAAFQAAFTKVGEDLQRLAELENPMAGLRGNKELDSAFERAASCAALAGRTTTGTPQATPTP